MSDKTITLLTDYQGRFGSKHDDRPYRSGMDREKLKDHFAGWGWKTQFIPFSSVDFFKTDHRGRLYLYTSSEDQDFIYKDYIEDIVYGLELAGAHVIPPYKYLRANNNKVIMEILRENTKSPRLNSPKSWQFGTLEEFLTGTDDLPYPCVLKTAAGASGRGVFLANNKKELIKKVKKISRTRNVYAEVWDWVRSKKHSGYTRESRHRSKFVIQDFIPNLKNDWKVYVFGKKIFIFYRPILKGRGIRASGGGYHNYSYGENANFPEGIFDFAKSIFEKLNVPNVSLDIVYDGSQFHLLEFQCVYFGTAGIVKSNCFYAQDDKLKWQPYFEKLTIERVFVDSVYEYIIKEKIK